MLNVFITPEKHLNQGIVVFYGEIVQLIVRTKTMKDLCQKNQKHRIIESLKICVII